MGNVVGLNAPAEGVQRRRQLEQSMTESAEQFEADVGHAPTAGVWVVMDENGSWRMGWDTRESDLKPRMAFAYALAALVTEMGQQP